MNGLHNLQVVKIGLDNLACGKNSISLTIIVVLYKNKLQIHAGKTIKKTSRQEN